jgi:hypothetical protein
MKDLHFYRDAVTSQTIGFITFAERKSIRFQNQLAWGYLLVRIRTHAGCPAGRLVMTQ